MSNVPHTKQHATSISTGAIDIISRRTHAFADELDLGIGLVRSFTFMHPISYLSIEEMSDIHVEGHLSLVKEALNE